MSYEIIAHLICSGRSPRPRALQLAQALRLKGRGPARHALPGIKRSLYREAPWQGISLGISLGISDWFSYKKPWFNGI